MLSGNAGCNANSIYFIDANNGWAVGHTSMGCFYNMFRSINGGVNWISQPNVTSESLNSVYFTDLNNGWAVGNNGTILHTTNGGVSFVEEEKINESLPTEFLLSNNYPNPFNLPIKIKYSVPQSSIR
ncbi:MAG: YCF48-related protein [Ignavibacteriales bacterium]|nr:YCF48-related protein [Ignavibacteriales bacterium]